MRHAAEQQNGAPKKALGWFPLPNTEQKQPHTESHSERCCDKPLIHLFVDLLLIHHPTPTNPRNHLRWDKNGYAPRWKEMQAQSSYRSKNVHVVLLSVSQFHIIPSGNRFSYISFRQTVQHYPHTSVMQLLSRQRWLYLSLQKMNGLHLPSGLSQIPGLGSTGLLNVPPPICTICHPGFSVK